MEENFVGVGHRRKHAALSALFQRLHTDIYGNRDFLHVLRRNFSLLGKGGMAPRNVTQVGQRIPLMDSEKS